PGLPRSGSQGPPQGPDVRVRPRQGAEQTAELAGGEPGRIYRRELRRQIDQRAQAAAGKPDRQLELSCTFTRFTCVPRPSAVMLRERKRVTANFLTTSIATTPAAQRAIESSNRFVLRHEAGAGNGLRCGRDDGISPAACGDRDGADAIEARAERMGLGDTG